MPEQCLYLAGVCEQYPFSWAKTGSLGQVMTKKKKKKTTEKKTGITRPRPHGGVINKNK